MHDSPGRWQAEESVVASELLSLGGQAHGHVRAVHVLRVEELLTPLVIHALTSKIVITVSASLWSIEDLITHSLSAINLPIFRSSGWDGCRPWKSRTS